jgi:hypothetical protein
MGRNSIRVVVATVLVSALASGFAGVNSASAAPITSAQAKVEYASSIAAAKTAFLTAVRTSRAIKIKESKRAEATRRLAVKVGLAKFNAVVAAERAPSLAAEKTYKASVRKSLGSPADLVLKTAVKVNLATLVKATSALKTDAKIADVRATFAKIRTSAMDKFKAALDISAKARARTLNLASLRYKANKAKAYATLQIAL